MFLALGGVLSVFLVVGLGFYASKRKQLTPEIETHISKLASGYAIPALIFHNTVTQLSPEFISENLGFHVFLPFGTIFLGYILARILTRILKIPAEEIGAASALFSMSNVVFIGVPVCTAVFGAWSAPYVISYLPANTILFWTIGNLGMMPGRKIGAGRLIKQIFSPPLLAFAAGLPFVFLGIKLPDFFLSAVALLAGFGTPAALLTVGGSLSRAGDSLRKIDKFTGFVVCGRSLIMPAITFAACALTRAPAEVTAVYTTISTMPVMSQAVLLSKKYDCVPDLVARAFAVTTIMTLILVPIVTTLLKMGFNFE